MEFVPDKYLESASSSGDASENILLPNWDSSHWDSLLRYTQTQMFSAGDTVLRAGSDERALYIVAFGRVLMFTNTKRRRWNRLTKRRMPPQMTVVETGSVMNVLTFLDDKPSLATYRASTECQILYLSLDEFTVFSARQPELGREVLLDLGRLVSLQVRRMSVLIASYGGDK